MLAGCAPAIIGGGAAVVGGAMVKEKGISGSLSDTQISTKISIALYQKDPELHARVNVNVQNGEVMLTGAVLTNEMHLDAVRIAWETPGVRRVIDNIAISEGASVGVYAKDTWITTQLKSKLLFDKNVQSINYSIKTVSGNVYLMGIAQDHAELSTVINYARNIDGVKKVTSYVRLKDEIV
ncbi:BON domain-containing protein [Candidatus Odyssella thessalonicensis]|uniref:BON domain-containing protein n=1 Tax=Candidatus Odyssella thessalonicensis TaxID=84647 RepID=UPI000225C1E1|nr:BON domain-containing protein [Candidatus Odyssella thessalonicensis]